MAPVGRGAHIKRPDFACTDACVWWTWQHSCEDDEAGSPDHDYAGNLWPGRVLDASHAPQRGKVVVQPFLHGFDRIALGYHQVREYVHTNAATRVDPRCTAMRDAIAIADAFVMRRGIPKQQQELLLLHRRLGLPPPAAAHAAPAAPEAPPKEPLPPKKPIPLKLRLRPATPAPTPTPTPAPAPAPATAPKVPKRGRKPSSAASASDVRDGIPPWATGLKVPDLSDDEPQPRKRIALPVRAKPAAPPTKNGGDKPSGDGLATYTQGLYTPKIFDELGKKKVSPAGASDGAGGGVKAVAKEPSAAPAGHPNKESPKLAVPDAAPAGGSTTATSQSNGAGVSASDAANGKNVTPRKRSGEEAEGGVPPRRNAVPAPGASDAPPHKPSAKRARHSADATAQCASPRPTAAPAATETPQSATALENNSQRVAVDAPNTQAVDASAAFASIHILCHPSAAASAATVAAVPNRAPCNAAAAPRPEPTMNGSVKSVTATPTPHSHANGNGNGVSQKQGDASRDSTSTKQTTALAYTTLFKGSKPAKETPTTAASTPTASTPPIGAPSAPAAMPFTGQVVAALRASIASLGPQIATALRLPSTAGDTRRTVEALRAENARKKAALADGRQRVQRQLEQRVPKSALVARLAEEAEQRLAEEARQREAIRTLDRHGTGMDEEAMVLRAKLFSDQ